MLENLCRGKRIDTGEMIVGYYIRATLHWHSKGCHEDWIVCSAIQNGGRLNICKRAAVDPETVGRCTGITDKNGKLIFAGDIIRVATFGSDMDAFTTEVCFGPRSGVQGFHLKNGRSMFYFGQSDMSKMDDAEVIGNIHDNPELREVRN